MNWICSSRNLCILESLLILLDCDGDGSSCCNFCTSSKVRGVIQLDNASQNKINGVGYMGIFSSFFDSYLPSSFGVFGICNHFHAIVHAVKFLFQ